MGNCASKKSKNKQTIRSGQHGRHSIRKEITHLERVKRLICKYLRPLIQNEQGNVCQQLIDFWVTKVLFHKCPKSRVAFQLAGLSEPAYYQFVNDLDHLISDPSFGKAVEKVALARVIELVMKKKLGCSYTYEKGKELFIINNLEGDTMIGRKNEPHNVDHTGVMGVLANTPIRNTQ